MRCLPQLTCVAIQRQYLRFNEQKHFYMAINHSHRLGNTAQQPLSALPTTGSASGRLITMPIEALHLHPAVENVGRMAMDEMGGTASSGVIQEPVLISPDGTILSGFCHWWLATQGGDRTISCIEYPVNEDEVLPFILPYHGPRKTWNAFVRVRMALTLELDFQQKAMENMRIGGRLKGSANLPDLARIDVREEIARVALVSPRNVTNVKTLLCKAHPRILQALESDALKINRALKFCILPQAEQLKQFTSLTVRREISKHIRKATRKPSAAAMTNFNAAEALEVLRQTEVERPGSLQACIMDDQTIVLFGTALLSKLSQGEVRTGEMSASA